MSNISFSVSTGLLRLAVLIGTRPEAIKLAPLIHLLKQDISVECTVVSTGQHKSMLDQVFELFKITPDIRLDVMEENHSLASLTSKVVTRFDELLSQHQFDLLIVQGDTTSAFVSALAAYYKKLPVAHVEAGLRSDNRFHPFPEEVNRRCISQLAEFHFCPTEQNAMRLTAEGVPADRIAITGNTGIDALYWVANRFERFADLSLENFCNSYDKLILVTSHRRENFGNNIEDICDAIHRIANANRRTVGIVFATHLNPNVQLTVKAHLSNIDNILLLPPQDYQTFIGLMKRSYFILSDSGGVQEEAPALGKPVIVMRKTTERPEAVEIGACRLVGTDPDRLFTAATELLTEVDVYRASSPGFTPYGDGKASERIVSFLLEKFELTSSVAK